MKAFITGGCGQVGSHVAEMLLARGDSVLAIDNFATGRPEHLACHPALTFVEGSIADKPLIDRLVGDFRPDVLIHTAASYKDPDDWTGDTLTNAVGGATLIKAAKTNQVGRFIYFQTALCYGVRPLHSPIRLDHPRRPDNSSYAISKTVTEDYLSISGLDYVTFRLANVIGPRNLSGPLPIFFQRLSQGKRCFVTTARRDFVFVKDLARTVLKAADGIGRGAYHFSSGTDVAIRELYDAVVEAMQLNTRPEPEIRPLGPDDAPTILLDPSRTFDDFGPIRFTPLKETVAAAVEYYRAFGVAGGGHTHLKHA
ncbi:MAG TPA: NAD-dependent epimerase/dehydratase family protein [Magnetospirillum sp.]|nr:NAD-dependent epimerase/dehydratase family protein [Magnetospirillum sp.]